MRTTLIPMVLLALTACPVQPVSPRVDASQMAVPSDTACAHLNVLGCPEGLDPACVRKLEQVRAERLMLLPLTCWQASSTRDAARACGLLECKER